MDKKVDNKRESYDTPHDKRKEQQQKATTKWNKEKSKMIGLRYKNEEYAAIKKAADKANLPMTTYCRQAIYKQMLIDSTTKGDN